MGEKKVYDSAQLFLPQSQSIKYIGRLRGASATNKDSSTTLKKSASRVGPACCELLQQLVMVLELLLLTIELALLMVEFALLSLELLLLAALQPINAPTDQQILLGAVALLLGSEAALLLLLALVACNLVAQQAVERAVASLSWKWH